MINENPNGVKIGNSAKLSLRLNDQKSSLNIKITRKYFVSNFFFRHKFKKFLFYRFGRQYSTFCFVFVN